MNTNLICEIIRAGTALCATREAITGLKAMRHTALSGPAYDLWAACKTQVTEDLDAGCQAWGIAPWEVTYVPR